MRCVCVAVTRVVLSAILLTLYPLYILFPLAAHMIIATCYWRHRRRQDRQGIVSCLVNGYMSTIDPQLVLSHHMRWAMVAAIEEIVALSVVAFAAATNATLNTAAGFFVLTDIICTGFRLILDL